MQEFDKHRVEELRRFINIQANEVHDRLVQLVNNTYPDMDVVDEVARLIKEYNDLTEIKNSLLLSI